MNAEQIVKILEATEKEGDLYSATARKNILKALERSLPLSTMSQRDMIEMLDTLWLKRFIAVNANIKEPDLTSGIKLIKKEVQEMHI